MLQIDINNWEGVIQFDTYINESRIRIQTIPIIIGVVDSSLAMVHESNMNLVDWTCPAQSTTPV